MLTTEPKKNIKYEHEKALSFWTPKQPQNGHTRFVVVAAIFYALISI